MAGFAKQDRTPRAGRRIRRNAGKLNKDFLGYTGGVTVDGDGKVTLNLADNAGLVQTGGLAINLASTPGLQLSTNELSVVAQGVLSIDAGGVKLNHGTGLQNDSGTLKTKDSEIVHDDLSGFVANEHIDWTSATENLATTGTITTPTMKPAAAGDTISIHPDATGDAAARVAFFENVDAATEHPALRIYGYAENIGGGSQKYVDIYINNYGNLFWAGDYTGLVIDAQLQIDNGLDTGNLLMFEGNRQGIIGLNRSGTKNHMLFGNEHTASATCWWLMSTWARRTYDFGLSDTGTPHLGVHSGLESQTDILDFYHNGTDGYIETQEGDIVLDPTGGTVDVRGTLSLTAEDIETDTTTGTKIGTSASQKLGFFGATPVVQQSHIADADGTLADITSQFNTLLSYLETYGLLATS